VSPRSGRAVSRSAGAPYHEKLLPLPGFLWRDTPVSQEEPVSREEIVAGLALTGYFLMHHVLSPHGGKLPDARQRFADRMRRAATAGIIDS
jgi:DNA repair protein RecO (recombination protein O)